VIDQITSNTGLNLPVVEMCRISKRYGCLIIVDAAHSLLSQDSTIFQQVIQYCDAWLSNGHKWLCMTKGCAYMWISSKMKSSIRPAIISHGYVPDEIFTKDRETHSLFSKSSHVLSSFIWDGCRDYSSILTTSSALLFWSKIFPTLLESHSR
jgi:selenocysteine lyase/cysteine desulfurase